MRIFDKLPTFDEYRRSYDDALRTQRERLRDDAVAAGVLRETVARAIVWVPWDDAAHAYATPG